MSRDPDDKADKPKGKGLKTNDQLTPKPPKNAQPRYENAPFMTIGTEKTQKTDKQLRNEADINRRVAEKRQNELARKEKGGLSQEFKREHDRDR